MLSRKTSLVIAIVILVVFAGLVYTTVEKSTGAISTNVALSTGYLKVENNTKPIYFITNNTSYIEFNMTVLTTASQIYVYDISPLNNTSYVWTNLTSLGKQNYELLNITNGTTVTVNLTLNQAAVEKMAPFDPFTHSGIYVVKIIVISSQGDATGFGFGLAKSSYP
ncbi:MAG TPA: hypothetical protein VKU79_01595 [Thermoplasmataceae archaeon]|nr:hypothetical protein [Thermoplasmatales archaeon AK]HLH85542.1 hypothetical protein [Thermoplasmataceae archaeon]